MNVKYDMKFKNVEYDIQNLKHWKSLFLSSDYIIEFLSEQNITIDDDSKYFRQTGLFMLWPMRF